MDFTHNTNKLRWLLYTLVIRDKQRSWVPETHMLTAWEDSDIVAAELQAIKRWCHNQWHLHYMLTDDSADEQSAVQKTFLGLSAGELEISHLLCKQEHLFGEILADEEIWNCFVFMFEDCSFEIYEGMGVTYSSKELQEEIEAPAKQRLEVTGPIWKMGVEELLEKLSELPMAWVEGTDSQLRAEGATESQLEERRQGREVPGA
ncbi:hypothetical protein MMC08_004335 [Hypocenomyce scalaris]|nr:hypothetical protein [Hypocenomyce scalaris]